MPSPQTDALLKKIGRRIAELRQDAEQTQEQLAAKLRITLKYLQRVEAGRHNLSVDSMVRFSRALKAEAEGAVRGTPLASCQSRATAQANVSSDLTRDDIVFVFCA